MRHRLLIFFMLGVLGCAVVLSASAEEPAAWSLADQGSLLDVSLGQACDDATKTIGKTKYRFSHQDLKIVAYNHLDHAHDIDIQCLSGRVVSVGVRRIGAASRFIGRREADLLTRATVATIKAAFGEPARAVIAPSGASSLYYCVASPDTVLALHFDAAGAPLQQLLLIDRGLLAPSLAGVCLPSSPEKPPP